VIFIKTLIQKINEFERASSLKEIAELISVYTILSEKEDFKKLKGIPKFTKANNWIPPITSEKLKVTSSKTPDSGTSSWNTLGRISPTTKIDYRWKFSLSYETLPYDFLKFY